MRLSKALFSVMFLLLLVFSLSAEEGYQEIAETRSAMLEGYEEAVALAEMSEEAYQAAAEAREETAMHADLFIEAIDAGKYDKAVEHAALSDEARNKAISLEDEAENHAVAAEEMRDEIVSLAREYASLNRDAAAIDRQAAGDISDILEQLPQSEEEPESVEESAEEPVEESPETSEEDVAGKTDEWLLSEASVVEDGMRYYATREQLEEYPVVAELDPDGQFVLYQEDEGISVGGSFITTDNKVGFSPNEFEGIPEDFVKEFYVLVDEFNVELPDTYWFEVSMEDDTAVLSAEGVIDGMDFSVNMAFVQQ
ncbi:MAG: hypothetical protein ACLFNK_03985 [Candidatus Woesearchaeota archaeon]